MLVARSKNISNAVFAIFYEIASLKIETVRQKIDFFVVDNF
jgi:hypothetical protein